MKTLRKLMFGCLALMVALSMVFVSCSDDDDDDDDGPSKPAPTEQTVATLTASGTDIVAVEGEEGKYTLTVDDSEDAQVEVTLVTTGADEVAYTVTDSTSDDKAVTDNSISDNKFNISKQHSSGTITITAKAKDNTGDAGKSIIITVTNDGYVVAPTLASIGNITTDEKETSISLTVSATAPTGVTFSYKWYKAESDTATSGTEIENANAATYSLPNPGFGTTYYYVEVTNPATTEPAKKASTTKSNIVKVTVDPSNAYKEVLPANLADQRTDGKVTTLYKANSYTVTSEVTGTPSATASEYNVTVNIEDLRLHQNAAGTIGYWVGVAIPAQASETLAWENTSRIAVPQAPTQQGQTVAGYSTLGEGDLTAKDAFTDYDKTKALNDNYIMLYWNLAAMKKAGAAGQDGATPQAVSIPIGENGAFPESTKIVKLTKGEGDTSVTRTYNVTFKDCTVSPLVGSEGDFETLSKLDNVTIKLANDITIVGTGDKGNEKFTFNNRSQTIDLDNHTLTTPHVNFVHNCNTTIKNGNWVSTEEGKSTASAVRLMDADKNSEDQYVVTKPAPNITLDNVKFSSKISGFCAAQHGDEGNALTIKNSEIRALGAYGISTNAGAPEAKGVKVVVEDSEIFAGSSAVQGNDKYSGDGDNTALMFNVADTVIVKNSIIKADRQAAFLRGGLATDTGKSLLKDSTFEATGKNTISNDRTGDWGNGNECPLAALVIGNKVANGSTSYNHAIAYALDNVTLKAPAKNNATSSALDYVSLYIYQRGTDKTTQITKAAGATSAFSNDCRFGDAKSVVVNAKSTANGATVATEVASEFAGSSDSDTTHNGWVTVTAQNDGN